MNRSSYYRPTHLHYYQADKTQRAILMERPSAVGVVIGAGVRWEGVADRLRDYIYLLRVVFFNG